MPAQTAMSAKQYKEYLEDMELKIRYMKNDIEFKQSKIQNKAVSLAASSATASTSHHLRQGQRAPVVQRQPHSSSIAPSTQRHQFFPRQPSLTQRPFFPSRTNNANPRTIPNNPSLQTRTTYIQARQIYPNNVKNACIERPTLAWKNSNYAYNCFDNTSNVKTVSSQSGGSSSSYNYSIPYPSPFSTHPQSLKSICFNQNPFSLNSANSKIHPLTQTQNSSDTHAITKYASTTVASQQFKGSTGSNKPIYVSPTKTKAECSSSQSSKLTVMSQKLGGNSHKNKVAAIDAKDHILNNSGRTSQLSTTAQNPCATDVSVSCSRFKLVKNKGQVVPATSNLYIPHQQVVNANKGQPNRFKLDKTKLVSSTAAGHGGISHTTATTSHQQKALSVKAQPFKKFHQNQQTCAAARKTPRLKLPTKLVSKYRMTRLSPTSASKVSPSFYHSNQSSHHTQSAQSHVPSDSGENIHKLDRRVTAQASTSAIANGVKSPNVYPPKLQVVIAAKLVSKYKLKRLSPTSTSKIAPSLFKGHNTGRLTSSSSLPTSRQSLSKHKLDRRSASSPGHADVPSKSNPSKFTAFKGYRVHNGKFQWAPHHKSNPFVVHGTRASRKLDRRQGISSGFGGSRVSRNSSIHRRNAHSATPVSRRHGGLRSRYNSRQLSFATGMHAFHHTSNSYKWSRNKVSVTHGKKSWPVYKYQRSPFKTTKGNLVMIHGVVHRTGLRVTSGHLSHAAQRRLNQDHHASSMKLITLRGDHFHTDYTGKKLCRASTAGEKKSPGVAVRRRHNSRAKHVNETSIIAASRIVHRSLNAAVAKSRKNSYKWKSGKQHCIFFGRFGKCHRGDKCPFVHDPHKVAMCTRFLRGKCEVSNCQFSHNASVHKMPVCLHYLQGQCTRSDCPYLHVKVNASAAVCQEFKNGYCSLGDKCKKLHSLVCPTFAVTGECSRPQPCTLLHRRVIKDSQANLTGSRNIKRKKRASASAFRAEKEKIIKQNLTQQKSLATKDNSPSLTADYSEGTNSTGAECEEKTVLSSSDVPNYGESTQNLVASGDIVAISKVTNDATTTKLGSPNPGSATVSPKLYGSPSKDCVPLASQPSFISLLDDSPQDTTTTATKRELTFVSSRAVWDQSQQTPQSSIKPNFLIRRAEKSGPIRELEKNTVESKSTNQEQPGAAISHTSAPCPSFLLHQKSVSD